MEQNSNGFPPFAEPVGTPMPEEEFLFPEGVPGEDACESVVTVMKNSPDGEAKGYGDYHASNMRRPSLFTFLPPPEKRNGASVLICPGGGYQILAIDKEGTDIARFFNSFGVSAFVLHYHLSWRGLEKGAFPYAPLRDAQRALRLIRSRADQYGLRQDQVGIMGFSAGGHLAACASTMYQDSDEPCEKLAQISCRPDFTILMYPVITFTELAGHIGSRDSLLGENASPAMKMKFSTEKQVTSDTPQAFLAQAWDDPVSVQNSLLYYSALRAANVPAEMHLYPEGGHGYGMHQRGMTIDSWPDRLKEWLLNLTGNGK